MQDDEQQEAKTREAGRLEFQRAVTAADRFRKNVWLCALAIFALCAFLSFDKRGYGSLGVYVISPVLNGSLMIVGLIMSKIVRTVHPMIPGFELNSTAFIAPIVSLFATFILLFAK